jgi:eukaryotic-like serine/threonine-protein kinase
MPTLDEVRAAFPRYTIARSIAAGGQGEVFQATRIKNPAAIDCNDPVALKMYFDPTQRERIRREVDAMLGYEHPNVAKFVEQGQVTCAGSDFDYVAWEFVDGESLDRRLQTGPLSPQIAARIGRDVARAIVHIWNKRIVHRDIKPANVVLKTGDNEAVLIDLGLARHLNETTITAVGAVAGTTGYFSPEQSRGERQLSCKSDVFALGVVLLQCLTGCHPTNHNQVLLATRPIKTAQAAPRCPANLAGIIDPMLSLRASFRPQPDVLAAEFAQLAATI